MHCSTARETNTYSRYASALTNFTPKQQPQALHKEGKHTITPGDATTVDGRSPGSEAWQQELTRLLLQAITATGVGYAWVDHPTVAAFFRAALPEFALPSAAQLAVLGGPCGSPSDLALTSSMGREGVPGVPQVITPPQQQHAASPSQLVVQPLTTLALAAAPPAVAMAAPMQQQAPHLQQAHMQHIAVVGSTGAMMAGAPVLHAVTMAPAQEMLMQPVQAIQQPMAQPMATYTTMAPMQPVQAVQPMQPVPMQQQAAAAMQAAQATLQAVQQANAQTNAVLAGISPGEGGISPPANEQAVLATPQPVMQPVMDNPMDNPMDSAMLLSPPQMDPTDVEQEGADVGSLNPTFFG